MLDSLEKSLIEAIQLQSKSSESKNQRLSNILEELVSLSSSKQALVPVEVLKDHSIIKGLLELTRPEYLPDMVCETALK